MESGLEMIQWEEEKYHKPDYLNSPYTQCYANRHTTAGLVSKNAALCFPDGHSVPKSLLSKCRLQW